MPTVLVPVRYPLSAHSRKTLREAVSLAGDDDDGELMVLHVDLYQNGNGVDHQDLKAAVEREVGPLRNARYNVRRGFLVEETILEEIASEGIDTVVLGHKQLGRWRKAFNSLIDDPDIAAYIEANVDCEVVIVGPD